LDLCGLGRHFLISRGEDVGRRYDLVRQGLLGDDVVAREHRLTPRIAGVIVGKRDFLAARVGQGRAGQNRPAERTKSQHTNSGFHRVPP